MSYLDNLENNLKALESVEEKDPAAVARKLAAAEAAREQARLTAPYREQLKKSPFTDALLAACRTLGHQRRMLVQFTWIDSTLRLDARNKRMELTPSPSGVTAIWSADGTETHREAVDFDGDATDLARRWLEA